jgi:hypothetical protein
VSDVRGAFLSQADSCDAMDAPFSARVLRLLADLLDPTTPLGARILSWPGDPTRRGDAVPLRLLGGLHALVLGRQDTGLAAAYAADGPTNDALSRALAGAMARHQTTLLAWLEQAPQTNEVRRSTVLIAAAHWLTDRFRLPLILSEAGASAGLNLLWDHFALVVQGDRFGPDEATLTLTPDWRGTLPPRVAPRVIARAGVDLRPIDPIADRQRLLAYVWAGQPERMARTVAALDLAARLRPPVQRGDAADWLAERLAMRFPGALHLIFHTVAWQYLPADRQARGEALIAAAGSEATPDAPLARFAMEADGGSGAALTLHLWPAGDVIDCGRADFHGRWVEWRAA